jgi:outer membrane protein assembly factor BamB
MRRLTSIIGLCAVLVAACGGDDDGLTCNLDEATQLAPSAWPMERRDPANTARIATGIDSEEPLTTCIFPGGAAAAPNPGVGNVADCAQGGSAITTTAIVGDTELIVGTRDGVVHVLDLQGNEMQFETPINLFAAVNSPLLGADDSIFVTATSGVLRRFDGADGEQLFSASFLDDIEVAPNIGPDGVIYAGNTAGTFGGVCTNGAFRFSRTLGSVSVPAAVTANPDDPERTTVLATADGGRVEALDDDEGELLWTFFTSGRIRRSAVVIDESRGIFMVADGQGQIFAASVRDGRARSNGADLEPHRAARCTPSTDPCRTNADCPTGETCSPETITASPALGAEHVYVATEGVRNEIGTASSPGTLYAFPLTFDGGGAAWTWTLPPGGVIRSSPVVLSGDDGDVIVFGADLDCPLAGDPCGAIAAVRDGELLWLVELPDAVGTASPSVRVDGDSAVIYIGTSAGKLYEVR